ncbi:hypothetical protein HMF3257_16970 [Spirosoma telluris]|uniref:Uncharacterized protein n=1 Tax=Spirosoma telluris TaxID=2183553 RepID=A0A327NM37_9BACT|nr:hypothetical protein HMF3257_16970 [Spirosoma telluris]
METTPILYSARTKWLLENYTRKQTGLVAKKTVKSLKQGIIVACIKSKSASYQFATGRSPARKH